MAQAHQILIEPATGGQLREICEARRSQRATKRAMKSNAAVGVSGIITFGHEAQPIFGALSSSAQDQAYREVAEAVASRIGTTLTGLVIHRDEAADHAHFQLPGFTLDGRPVSQVAKREALRDMQTLAADIMQRYAPGIERGKPRPQRLAEGESYADTVYKSSAVMRDLLSGGVKAAEAERDQAQSQAREAHAMMQASLARAGDAHWRRVRAETETSQRQRERDQAAAEVERFRLEANQQLERLRVNLERAEKAQAKADGDDERAEKARKNALIYERRAQEARDALDSLNERHRTAQEALEDLLAEREALTASLEPLRAAAALLDAHEAAEVEREARERQAAENANRFDALKELFVIGVANYVSDRSAPVAAWMVLEPEAAAEAWSYINAKGADGPLEIRQHLENFDTRSQLQISSLSDESPSFSGYTLLGYTVAASNAWDHLMKRLDRWGRELASRISKAIADTRFIFTPAPPPPEAKPAEKLPSEVRAALRRLDRGPEPGR